METGPELLPESFLLPALPASGAKPPAATVNSLLAVLRSTTVGEDGATLQLPSLTAPGEENAAEHFLSLLTAALRGAQRKPRSCKAAAAPAAAPLLALAGEEAGEAAADTPGRWNKNVAGKNLWRTVESLLEPHGAEGMAVSEIIKMLNAMAAAEGCKINVGSLRNTLSQHRDVFDRIGPGNWALLKYSKPGEERKPRTRKPRVKKAAAIAAAAEADEEGAEAEEPVEAEEPAGEEIVEGM